MAKQSLKQKETEVSTNEGTGKQIEKYLRSNWALAAIFFAYCANRVLKIKR